MTPLNMYVIICVYQGVVDSVQVFMFKDKAEARKKELERENKQVSTKVDVIMKEVQLQ